MKEQDIEKLKEFCEREGFELKRNPYPGIEFEISKKDPWDGVEFARCVNKDAKHFTTGKIYKILPGKSIHDDLAFLDESGKVNGYWPCNTERFQPATEQEYIEQLIKESKERFGEIKEGDRFVDPEGDEFFVDGKKYPGWEKIKEWETMGFTYHSNNDQLLFDGFAIYQSGKWAEKVEKAKVEYLPHDDFTGIEFKPLLLVNKQAKKKMQEIGLPELGDYLAEKLEDYLNEV